MSQLNRAAADASDFSLANGWYTFAMEKSVTEEGLVRRTIVKPDGRFLYFYNAPGEDQPIDEGGELVEALATDAEVSGKDLLPNV